MKSHAASQKSQGLKSTRTIDNNLSMTYLNLGLKFLVVYCA